MANKKYNASSNILFWIISLILVNIFYMFSLVWKIMVKIIVFILKVFGYLITGIISLIINLIKNHIDDNENTIIENEEPIEYKTKSKKENIKTIKPSITHYDYLFKKNIIERGIQYFNNDEVLDYKFENQTCTAIIKENFPSITFYKNGKIKTTKCTCPYFKKDKTNCKHIYALLLKYGCEEKIVGFNIKQNETSNKFAKELINICNSMSNIINETEKIYKTCKFRNDIDVISDYEEIISYKDKIFKYENLKIFDLNKQKLENIKENYDELKNTYENLIYEIEQCGVELENEYNYNTSNNALTLKPINSSVSYNNKINDKRKNKKNTDGLMDYEIEEIEKGDYDAWNFEEEELEDDDL